MNSTLPRTVSHLLLLDKRHNPSRCVPWTNRVVVCSTFPRSICPGALPPWLKLETSAIAVLEELPPQKLVASSLNDHSPDYIQKLVAERKYSYADYAVN